MPRFRKKPVEIEARLLTRDNFHEVREWAGCKEYWGLSAPMPSIHIETLEGIMHGKLGDWIIQGVQGEFYPCKPDIFDATYEPVSK